MAHEVRGCSDCWDHTVLLELPDNGAPSLHSRICRAESHGRGSLAHSWSTITPALLPAGGRDNAEGHCLGQCRVLQRPDHRGEAVHRFGGLLHWPLRPLPGPQAHPWAPGLPIGHHTWARRDGKGRGSHFCCSPQEAMLDPGVWASQCSSRQVVPPAKTSISLHPLPCPCLPPRTPRAAAPELSPF